MSLDVSALDKKQMSSETMLAKIQHTVKGGSKNSPPAYTLILGAGASFGVVPTAKEMLGLPDSKTKKIHDKCIPLWLSTLGDEDTPLPTESHRLKCVVDFWRDFKEANSSNTRTDNIKLDADGFPSQDCIAEAYQAVFDTSCVGGVDTPEKHRAYTRDVTMATQGGSIPLNATHFYLASLLSLQRRRSEKGPNGSLLYNGQREFARTIFTTNFDPLLQTSLQLFQLLYYMTDRPESLSADALQTDEHPAIHLFYAHGSVHRPFLANTEAQIEKLKVQNSRDLAAYLGTHGVIVLGYSGWDDCLLDALKQTKTFSNNLYWLVRGKDSISPKVRDFLEEQSNAYWVSIADGGHFMASLHERLCPGVPNTEMLYNPIRPLICQLECVTLAGVVNNNSEMKHSSAGVGDAPVEVDSLRLQIINRLQDLQRSFTEVYAHIDFEEIWKQAELSFAIENWTLAATGYKQLIEQDSALTEEKRVCAHFRWAVSLAEGGCEADAIEAYSSLIAADYVSKEYEAKALVNRGVLYGSLGLSDLEVADYNEVLEMIDVCPEQESSALYNRAVYYDANDDPTNALEDYKSVIAMEMAPPNYKGRALFNVALLQEGASDLQGAINSYTSLIALSGADEHKVTSLINRGKVYTRVGLISEAIADFSRVIETKNAKEADLAISRFLRGICYNAAQNYNDAVTDLSSCLESTRLPRSNVACANLGLGSAFHALGKKTEAARRYAMVIDSPHALSHEQTAANEALVKLLSA